MARALRLQYSGAIYHVTARGNERRELYRDDRDRGRFIEKLAENIQAHHVRLYAYVLMRNHYHLLLETPRGNLVDFMQPLNGSYSVYFNTRHRRIGHLLAGRYKAKVVEGDPYLLRLTRYVHLNPVKVKAAQKQPLEERQRLLREYRWSSYPGYVGLSDRVKWVDYGPLSDLASRGRQRQAEAYRQFVESGLVSDDAELRLTMEQSSKAIGSGAFRRWAEETYRELTGKQGQPLDVAMRRCESPVPAEKVLSVLCEHAGLRPEDLRRRRHISDDRLLAMKLLKEEAGLTQRGVAEQLGLRDGSGISRWLAGLNVRLEEDSKLKKRLAELTASIRANH